MNRRRSSSPRWPFPVITLAAIPAVAVTAKLVAGDQFPTAALVVMSGVYLMGLAWAAMSLGLARERVVSSSVAGMSAAAFAPDHSTWPELELLYSVLPPPRPLAIQVVDGAGVCPFGKEVSTRLEVGADGSLSEPLCRAAIKALTPVLADSKVITQVRCVCPLAMRHRSFEVRPARGEPDELVGVA